MKIMAIEMPDGRWGYLGDCERWWEIGDTVGTAEEWQRLNDRRWHEVLDEDDCDES